MKTLILGLGNPILSDDGVGFRVVEELKSKINHKDISVTETSAAGLEILNLITGYEKVIIIDAIQTGEGDAGQIYRLLPGSLDYTLHAGTPHDVNLATALGLGRKLNLDLPREIIIFAIEVLDTTSFSERCTPEVESAILVCIEKVVQELEADISIGS